MSDWMGRRISKIRRDQNNAGGNGRRRTAPWMQDAAGGELVKELSREEAKRGRARTRHRIKPWVVTTVALMITAGSWFAINRFHNRHLDNEAKAAAIAHQGEYANASVEQLTNLFRVANKYAVNAEAANVVYNVAAKCKIGFEDALLTIAYNFHDRDGSQNGIAETENTKKANAQSDPEMREYFEGKAHRAGHIRDVMVVAGREFELIPGAVGEFGRICPQVRDMLSPKD